jgi:DNA-directed RNA polymerase sigma subunit (sigma70/sigma32)
MVTNEGDAVDPTILQADWDRQLAGERLGPITEPDTLGFPAEVLEARRVAQDKLGELATAEEEVEATIDELRGRHVRIRDLGFKRWRDLSTLLLGQPQLLKREISGDLGTEAETLIDATAESPFGAAALSLSPAELSRLLAPLEEREAEILRLRFGLDRGQPRSLEEVGQHFSETREAIRKIEIGAMRKLRSGGRETKA